MSDPAYLRNLKEHARAQYGTKKESNEAVAALQYESDRGAIILSATAIEDALEMALGQKMKILETDLEARARVFGAEGTISTYADKTLIAYALGIIDRQARKEIDLIRHIRNACAHSRKPLTLNMPVLADAVKVVIGEDFFSLVKEYTVKTLRAGFICQCAALGHYVTTGQRKGPLDILAEAAVAESQKPPAP